MLISARFESAFLGDWFCGTSQLDCLSMVAFFDGSDCETIKLSLDYLRFYESGMGIH